MPIKKFFVLSRHGRIVVSFWLCAQEGIAVMLRRYGGLVGAPGEISVTGAQSILCIRTDGTYCADPLLGLKSAPIVHPSTDDSDRNVGELVDRCSRLFG